MNTRKNQILSLLIVGVLATIGIGATETQAAVIPVQIKAVLKHPVLAAPILLHGHANVHVAGGMINLGTFFMIAPGGTAKAKVKWYPTSVNPADGTFTAYGSGYAKLIDPATGVVKFVRFRMLTKGRTNGINRIHGKFKHLYTSTPFAGLRGKYRH
jgi:hypothetical protein